jgi:vacuolar-type H+-ATPase subunit E/Vma4
MSDETLRGLKAANAELLREKAEAVKAWHEEIRHTLAHLGMEVATIKAHITATLQLQERMETLEVRLKTLEDFKLKAVSILAGAIMVLGLFWKLIDKFWP